jgi:hypothetical protein
MINFEDIKRANDTIRTTDIKGKDYAEVNQRIKAFRMVYPTGTIRTEIISIKDGVCIIRAEVRAITEYREGQFETVTLGTGTAYEKEGSSFINSTSYIENCETSAVGRALGMAGFGIDVSVASAEEVQNAILNQKGKPQAAPAQAANTAAAPAPASVYQKTTIRRMLTPEQIGKAEKKYGLEFANLTFDEAAKIIKRLTPAQDEQEGA